MACCLTAPSHYLNQGWLIIKTVLWHSSESITRVKRIHFWNQYQKFGRSQWVQVEIRKSCWYCIIWIKVKPCLQQINRWYFLRHNVTITLRFKIIHDDVIKWKHFPRYWPFVRGIHWSRWIPRTKASDAELWALMFSLIYVWINGWVNNSEADDLRRYRGHYDVNVM